MKKRKNEDIMFDREINKTIDVFIGECEENDLQIPPDMVVEVVRGACLLESYTLFEIDFDADLRNELRESFVEYTADMSDGWFRMYTYGAIQLRNHFNQDDCRTYYQRWVGQVIIPALKIMIDYRERKNNDNV